MCICIRGGFTCPPAFFSFFFFDEFCELGEEERTHPHPPLLADKKLRLRLRLRLQTVHSPLVFRKIVEIERFNFALRAAILYESQNYLEGGGAVIPDASPLGT